MGWGGGEPMEVTIHIKEDLGYKFIYDGGIPTCVGEANQMANSLAK